ncbi:MAG: glycosyltransferase [Elainellaceae cyanobacterium]
MEYPASPFVSVIVPVFNDADGLKLCLAALSEQSYAQSRFEVIIVDNGSDDPEQIKTIAAAYDWVTVATETSPGSYAARNRGLDLARGDVMAFTDADCIPAPDWLENGVYILKETPNCGLVAGQIRLFFRNPSCPTMVELYESVRALPQQEFVEDHHYGATANVFTTRHVIDTVGKFDARLKSSGDAEWGKRVHAQGFRQVYAEKVIVQHPTRSSFRELYVRTRRLAGGHYDLQLYRATTPWQRQCIFWRSLTQNLTPPVFFAINTFLDTRLNSVGQKLKVSSVMLLVRYISAWEILRLKFGGVSNRA